MWEFGDVGGEGRGRRGRGEGVKVEREVYTKWMWE